MNPLETAPELDRKAWNYVLYTLRGELDIHLYNRWVEPIRAGGLEGDAMRLTVPTEEHYRWVESRLGRHLRDTLTGFYARPIALAYQVGEDEAEDEAGEPPEPQPASTPAPASPAAPAPEPPGSARKQALHEAYGSRRAGIIHPEKTQFITHYFLQNWLPLVGSSGMAVILAARSFCYWNPLTGQIRNRIDLTLSDLAERAGLSLRALKYILNQDLVKNYFIRYRVRRFNTSSGPHTMGVTLLVNMEDPLTPQDQQTHGYFEKSWIGDFDDDLRNGTPRHAAYGGGAAAAAGGGGAPGRD